MPASATAGVADADASVDRPSSLRDRLKTVARYDLPASIVVFLVAVPLSIGIAIASNAPIMAGLIAAIVGGMKLANQSDDVARTLVAMSQRGTVNDSRRLAETIVRTFGSSGVRLLPRTHRQAGFAVLTSPDIPAALVELGYLSNPQDEKLLTVRQHQAALARALRASVDAHFGSGIATRKA